MYAYFLALIGAICWGLAPIFGKIGLRHLNPVDGLFARTLLTVLFVSLFFLGASGSTHRVLKISPQDWFFIALEAFFATFAGDLAYYAAIKMGKIGTTTLILSTAPLLTIWLGWFFLGETLTLAKLIGALLIVSGMILLGIRSP